VYVERKKERERRRERERGKKPDSELPELNELNTGLR
jgi:hypothetical protein